MTTRQIRKQDQQNMGSETTVLLLSTRQATHTNPCSYSVFEPSRRTDVVSVDAPGPHPRLILIHWMRGRPVRIMFLRTPGRPITRRDRKRFALERDRNVKRRAARAQRATRKAALAATTTMQETTR
jgi:hypothetical protein